jgi:hypothetical protein
MQPHRHRISRESESRVEHDHKPVSQRNCYHGFVTEAARHIALFPFLVSHSVAAQSQSRQIGWLSQIPGPARQERAKVPA